jgi:hypothetical protein
MLTEPSLQHRFREGTPGRLTLVIDDSESMTLRDGRKRNRYERAVSGLLDTESDILSKLAENHELRVVRGSSDRLVELWKAGLAERSALPTASSDWSLKKFEARSAIGELVRSEDSSILVLLTDGRTNAGKTLSEVIDASRSRKQTVFTVGFGEEKTPPELSIISVEHPDRLFRRDRLNGKVVVTDSFPAGENFQLQAIYNGEIVWEQPYQTDGSGQRAIGFSISIEPLISQTLSLTGESVESESKKSAVPLGLQFRFVQAGSDEPAGQPYEIRLWGALHRSKILLVDGRSRWESRYLKNVFDRDPFWEIVPVIAEADSLLGGGLHLPADRKATSFPKERELLMEFDLVVLGDFPLELLSSEEQRWLVDYVEESGGGLIIVDGQRGYWQGADDTLLQSLLPVERMNKKNSDRGKPATLQSRIQWRANLTSTGKNTPALDIRSNEQSDALEAWHELPPFDWTAAARALPGTDVLASLKPTVGDPAVGDTDKTELPFLATRLVGAGRVLYAASDETWRWRYKVADQVHQRFWNQTARWIMRTPFVSESEYVALDAGRMNYTEGQTIELRCRLRQENGAALKDGQVQGIIECDGRPAIMVPLETAGDLPGVYRGSVNDLEPGSYAFSVSAVGIPQNVLDLSTEFRVVAESSIELNEKSTNASELKRIAEATGGAYLTEDQLTQLLDRLKPFSQGKIVETESPLWQSWYWFFPVIVLLASEWYLRKRIGLI